MPPPAAVLDASVLYSRHLRNTLVWHSLEGLFELRFSALILEETRRSLIERNLVSYGDGRAVAVDGVLDRVTSALSALYPDCEVPTEQIESVLGGMTNDPKDRHVLAAAVATRAPFLVTANLKHFRAKDTNPHGVTAMSPDAFLTKLLDDEDTLGLCSTALTRQADFHGWPLAQLLTLIGQPRAGRPAYLPRYVRRYEQLTGTQPAEPAD